MRIRVNTFGGIQPNTDPRLLPNGGAQLAHNCLLEDGALQAMPQWSAIGDGPTSIGPPVAGGQYSAFQGYCGLSFFGPPFGVVTIYLDDSGALVPSVACSAVGSVAVEPAGLSPKAVNRVYGVTATRTVGGVTFESALSLLSGNNPKQVMYEGDQATLTLSGTGDTIRLYRSTSDVTTGAGTNGAMTANWQLVSEMVGSPVKYVDAGAAVADPFDTYLYRGPITQPFVAYRMGLLDSGYVWLVSEDGQVALSDRFAWAVWPVENVYSLGNSPNGAGVVVTGTASTRDTIYVGTQIGVYAATAHVTGEGGAVLGVELIHGAPPCLPNTMTATPFGAMYTSAQGVVSLSGDQATLVSRALARGSFGVDPAGNELLFTNIGDAVYHNGKYYGVSGGLPPPLSLTGHLVDAYQNTVVSYQYFVGGGTAPRTVTVHSGALPVGLSISATGLVTGKRTTAGLYTFELQCVDSLGAIVYLNDTSTTISTDLIHWRLAALPAGMGSVTDCAIFGDVCVVVGQNFLGVSGDRGVTWTKQSISGFFSSTLAINFQGDWYVFDTPSIANGAKTIGALEPLVFTSFANAPDVNGVGVLGNYLYGGQYASTPNYVLLKMLSPGSAWQAIDTGVPNPSFSGISAMLYTGSSYLFTTMGGDILRSMDLIYFTVQASGLSTDLRQLAVLNGVVIASDQSTSTYHSTDDGVTWGLVVSGVASLVGATPSMFVAGYTYTISTGTDGFTWTPQFIDGTSAIEGRSCVTPTLALFVAANAVYVGSN